MYRAFISESFEVVKFYDTEYFHFRVLEPEVAELDFEAVMSSQKSLQGIFGPESEWPESDMTLKENIESLKVHQREFELREAFAYSVFNPTKDKCLGSVYIDPSQSPNYDCVVHFWLRDDSSGLDNVLYQTVLNWLQEDWPFVNIAFPGRKISWKNWKDEHQRTQ